MQGGAVPAGRQEEARSETYLAVRCNDERPYSPFERGRRSRKLLGEVRKGGVPPSEESLRPRWAFFSSLLGAGRSGAGTVGDDAIACSADNKVAVRGTTAGGCVSSVRVR